MKVGLTALFSFLEMEMCCRFLGRILRAIFVLSLSFRQSTTLILRRSIQTTNE